MDTSIKITPLQWLRLGNCGININLETGEVVIPDGLSLDDAARAFWEAVRAQWRPIPSAKVT